MSISVHHIALAVAQVAGLIAVGLRAGLLGIDVTIV
jgi:hypothetical protein